MEKIQCWMGDPLPHLQGSVARKADANVRKAGPNVNLIQLYKFFCALLGPWMEWKAGLCFWDMLNSKYGANSIIHP